MNTLRDLYDTLESHAAAVPVGSTSARVDAVRRRVQAARRRRSTAVALVALVAVAAAAVTLFPRDPDLAPTDRDLVGKTAPATIERLGYSFEFVAGVENPDGRAELRLDASESPRLVSWASESDRVELRTPLTHAPDVSRQTDFSDSVLVLPGERGRILALGDGPTAWAVYEFTDTPPDGVTVDGITFRERAADATLVGATFGEPGQDEVSLTVTLPEAPVRISALCTGAAGQAVRIDLGPAGVWWDRSCAERAFDPGGTYVVDLRPGELGSPGEDVSLDIRIAGDPGARELVDARIGLGLYAIDPPAARPLGASAEPRLEQDGRSWRYTETVVAPPGARELALDRDPDRPTYAMLHMRGFRGSMSIDRGPWVDQSRAGPGAGNTLVPVAAGSDPFVLRLRNPPSDRSVLAVSLYERAD